MVGMHILNITHIAIEGRTLEEEGRVEHHLKTYMRQKSTESTLVINLLTYFFAYFR